MRGRARRRPAPRSPLSLTEIRGELRDIFISHATPARLAALARAAGLPAALVGGRQIAVLDAADQRRRTRAGWRRRCSPSGCGPPRWSPPSAPHAAEAASVRDALGTLTDHGIRVVDDRRGSHGRGR